jgi:hypothetical protein
MWLKTRIFMNESIPLSLLAIGLLAIAPLAANALGTQAVSLNLERETNVLPAQVHRFIDRENRDSVNRH